MGSNYLLEVLSSEDGQLPNITSKISELLGHANNLKAEVSTVVQDRSVQFTPLLQEISNLILKSNNLLKEISTLKEQIEGEIKNELSSCDEELKNLSSSLKEVKLFLGILEELLKINTLVRNSKEQMEKKEFYECAKSVITVQALVKSNSEKLKSVEIFKILSQEVNLTYEQLLYNISEVWSQCFSVTFRDGLEENPTEINIFININFYNDLSQILNASDLLQSNLIEKKFSKTLLNNVLKKVILNKSQIESRTEGDKAVMEIRLSHNNNIPNYSEVFSNLKLIIQFIKSHLDIKLHDGTNFLSKIGSFVSCEFSDFLIKNCLSETIPTSSDDLDKYKIVVDTAEEFEKTLQEIGFLPSDSSPLLDYAKNVNVLFANKFCQSYLHKARIIMKKDLHDVTYSKDISTNINVLPHNYKKVLRERLNVQGDIFSLPKCQISVQAEELVTLIRSMMKEIERSSDLCAVRLFFTVRNIFEMYSAVVPLHHKKFLEKLPHQVAVFHNNCLYFTHNLINLVVKYYKNIPSILEENFKILLEEAIVLRSLAAETLEVTVTNIKSSLIYILRDSGFATLNENPNLDAKSERSLRQCMRQLQVLKNVWSEVLPSNVYNRAIGFLLDTIMEELINLIISTEDISSQTANDLVSSFTFVLDKGPGVLLDSEEVYMHSKKFLKFEEFVRVLKGSLRDIDDRWAGGLGPLALEFTAEQVKHLIRALFQNSEKRAALLAKIKLRRICCDVCKKIASIHDASFKGIIIPLNLMCLEITTCVDF